MIKRALSDHEESLKGTMSKKGFQLLTPEELKKSLYDKLTKMIYDNKRLDSELAKHNVIKEKCSTDLQKCKKAFTLLWLS